MLLVWWWTQECGALEAAELALCRGQLHLQCWRSTAKADNGTMACVVIIHSRWRASNNNNNSNNKNNDNNNNNSSNSNNNNSQCFPTHDEGSTRDVMYITVSNVRQRVRK